MVDPVTFEEFYRCWKANEAELQQLNIPIDAFDGGEGVYKVSDLVKCGFGTGRILLTASRSESILVLKDM